MISNKFYNAFKRANMLVMNVSPKDFEEQIQDPSFDKSFKILEEMEEHFNKFKNLNPYILEYSHLVDYKETIIIMEKILTGELF